jgi:hypothetical protein
LHEAESPGSVQPHKLLGIAAVGLDTVARADGDQRRRDDVARDPDPCQQSQQLKAAGPGLITHRQPIGAAEAIDEAADRALGRLDALDLGLTAGWRQDRGDDRELVHVQGDPQAHIRRRRRANVRHGLILQCRMRLWPKRPSTPHSQPATDATREGQPRRVHPG